MSTVNARNENVQALQKDTVDLTDLDGLQLPPGQFDRFIERVQEEADLLDLVRTTELPRQEMSVPQIGVPEMPGGTRTEGGSRTGTDSASSGSVKLNTTDQYYYIQYDLKEDAVDNTMSDERVGRIILDHFQRAWANGAQNIAINANRSGSSLPTWVNDTWDGWIGIAEGNDTASDRIGTGASGETTSTMPVYDHTGAGVNNALFNGGIQAVDERYRDTDDLVFLMSKSQVQAYYYELTEREDGLGVAALMGNNDVTPFEYDIIGASFWPDDYGMLIDPNQLVMGTFEEMFIERLTNSDKTMDEALHSRSLIEGQFDLQIEELQSGALITNIAAP
jgi:hypothetical protein